MSVPRFTIVRVGNSDNAETAEDDVLKQRTSFARTPTDEGDLQNDANDDCDAAPFLSSDKKGVSDAAYYLTCGEAKPHPDNYRVHCGKVFRPKRPTLEQLHEAASCEVEIAPQTELLLEENEAELREANAATPDADIKKSVQRRGPAPKRRTLSLKFRSKGDSEVTTEADVASTGIKLGWIRGVLVRCVLTIWGVLLFVRLTWIVGEAGTGCTAAIIALASVVTIITTTSLSAICTNGEVGNGGIYFLTSRSLGAEFGGLVGVIFSIANIIAVAMHTVGFAETLVVIFSRHCWSLTGSPINDIRFFGMVTVVVLLGIAIIGVRYESVAQVGLLILLVGALMAFFVGSFIPPDQAKIDRGLVGYNATLLAENFMPSFSEGESFFTVFAVFFPAATGILSGANISGDLKDPSSAIPRGTLLAIAITSTTYLLVSVIASGCVWRDYVPVVSFAVGLNATASPLLATNSFTTSLDSRAESLNSTDQCRDMQSTRFGLKYDMQIVEMMSACEPLVFAGIFAAALSSALAALVSAPKMLQRICSDRLFPIRGLTTLGRGFGRDDEPRLLYALSAVLAAAFVAIGSLNVISGIVSNFYMCTYIFINFSCFSASITHAPGWRPKFRYYNQHMSLFGALLCVGCMFIMNWWAALLTIGVSASLYVYLHFRKPDHANWGSSIDANAYRQALQGTYHLVWVAEHVKNFRPQILVLSGAPYKRPLLVDLAAAFTKNVGLLVCADVCTEPRVDFTHWKLAVCEGYTYLRHRKIQAFYNYVQASSLRSAVNNMLQMTGLGKIKPNIVLLGYKSDWRACASRLQSNAEARANGDEVENYVNILHDAFDLHYGVAILRLSEKLRPHDYEGLTLRDFLTYDLRAKQEITAPTTSATSFEPRTRNLSESLPSTTNMKAIARCPSAAALPQTSDAEKSASSFTHTDPTISITAHSRVVARSIRKSVSESLSSVTITSELNDTDSDRKKLKSKRQRHRVTNLRLPRQRGARLEVKSPEVSASRMTINEDIIEIRACSSNDLRTDSSQQRSVADSSDSPQLCAVKNSHSANRKSAQSRTCADSEPDWLDGVEQQDSFGCVNAFRRKQSGRIDVWWLYDDGGLTLLMPHILSTRANWKDCQLRVLTQPMHARDPNEAVATAPDPQQPQYDSDASLNAMLLLLAKFRIDCRDVEILTTFDVPPRDQTVREFEESIAEWRLAEGECKSDWPSKISDEELSFWKRKTDRYLRVRELLLEQSFNATLIVLTLPIPRKGVNSALYLAWLDALTRDLPNTLLLRGNQRSVLTYYT